MRPRFAFLIPPLLLVALLIGGISYLGSSGGLPAAIRLLTWLSQDRLQVRDARGALSGPLDIAELHWQDGTQRIEMRQFHLDWTPRTLWQSWQLHIRQLSIGEFSLDSPPSADPIRLPDNLRLPLGVTIEALQIDHLTLTDSPPLEGLQLSFSSDGRQHRVLQLRGQGNNLRFVASGDIDGASPFNTQWQAQIDSQLDDKELAIELQVSGQLPRLTLLATARRGFTGQASALLTPFQRPVFTSARLLLTDIDPAAWHPAAPTGKIDLTADIVPDGNGFIGSFGLSNHLAGLLDRQRLPLSTLAGGLRWQNGKLELSDLYATLPGRGELTGTGQLTDGKASLALLAHHVDLAQADSRLRSTRLAGNISLQANAGTQQLQLHLRDPHFALDSELRLDPQRIALQTLALHVGQSRLEATGYLDRAQPGQFAAEGTLSRFNPADFARVSSAHLNAHFNIDGHLQPRAYVNAQFALQDSRLAGQPLAGNGRLSIDWPRIPQADIRLQAGANQLIISGAFGQPGDTLHGELQANDLSLFGLEGELIGQIDLRGSVAYPSLQARLNSRRLGQAGQFRASKLAFTAQMASAANSPLQADLSLGQLDTPTQTAALSDLQIRLKGQRDAHQITLSSHLAQHQTLQLRAEGAWLGALGWQGKLTEGRWQKETSQPAIVLQTPADITVATTQWRIGPLNLVGHQPDWQASLEASASDHQLNLRLQASSAHHGQLQGELSAGLRSPWALDPLARWQGQLRAQAERLDTFGTLLGEGWESGGQMKAELNLAGHPERPRLNGLITAQALSLRQRDQGLALTEGKLNLSLIDNLLKIERFSFVSPHRPPPVALTRSIGEQNPALADPGKLSIGGQLQFIPEQGDVHGWLDLTLERVGAWQLPEQWISLSGQSRLGWQDGQLAVRGQLVVDAGYWQLAPTGAPRLSDDVVVRRLGAALPVSDRPQLELDLTTDIGRNFLFETSGLSTRLAGEIRLQASGRDLPRASGRIRTRGGRFAAYGQKLDIERGQLSFQGLLDDPALDVRAIRKGLPVEAGVQVSGTAQRPVIKLISDPTVPDAEKLTWLILGHAPEQNGSGDAALLLSAAGGLLGNESGGVVQQLKENFGLDEIGIRQGELGESGGPASTSRVAGRSVANSARVGQQIFSVSKRLSESASLSYEQALGKTESIVKLSLEIGRNLTLVGRAGSDNALGLFYTLTFGRPPTAPKPDPTKSQSTTP